MKKIYQLLNIILTIGAPTLVVSASPLGTGFTYQGSLNDGASTATGIYELRFALYDSPSTVMPTGSVLTNVVAVTNGLFITCLDFGSAVFDGSALWLGMGVRTYGSRSEFTVLEPRQPISPMPYAVFALNLAPQPGASGFKAFVGGGIGNTALGDYATVAGGFNNKIEAASSYGAVGGGAGNHIGHDSDYASVGGGWGNTVWDWALGATVSGGEGNGVGMNCSYATIAGGRGNTNNTLSGTISGGSGNYMDADLYASIGGGVDNWIRSGAASATIGGGERNLVEYEAQLSTIAGGRSNRVNQWAQGATVGGGAENTIDVSSSWATVAGGLECYIGSYCRYATIGGPMAQDFKATFGVGESETGITMVDADGVALAAIKGLNQIVREKDTEIQALKQRLEAIERLLQERAGK